MKTTLWIVQIDVGMTLLFCDNQIHVKVIDNLMFHDKTKNIQIKYHYIHDIVQKGGVMLQYIATDEQTTDILIKHLSQENRKMTETLGEVARGINIIERNDF